MDRAQREPEPEEHDEGRRQTAGEEEKTGEMRVKEKKRSEGLESEMIFYKGKICIQRRLFGFLQCNFSTTRCQNSNFA